MKTWGALSLVFLCLICQGCSKDSAVEPVVGPPISDLGRLRESWTLSSPPAGADQDHRSKIVWYNPYYDYYSSDVYPGDTSQHARHKVFIIKFAPQNDSSWGGIMRAFSSTFCSDSGVHCLELRLGTFGNTSGTLHIDLGRIPEDIDGDGILDDEDRHTRDEQGVIINIRDHLLSPEEDTGLDMLFSPDEPGYDPVENPDPSGDDWDYDDDDPENYEQINGTEGNSKGDLRGDRPDSEDINGSSALDAAADYYSYTVDLTGSLYLIEGTEYHSPRLEHGERPTFRTYLIPLWPVPGVESIGNPDAQDIKFGRIWLDGFTEEARIVIGKMEIIRIADTEQK